MTTDANASAHMRTSAEHRLARAKPLPNEVDVFGITHPGRVRATNADHYLIASFYRAMKVHSSSLEPESFPPLSTYTRGFLFLVADGVGALSQAAEGSATAIQAVSQYILDMSDVSMQAEPSREPEVAERMRTFALRAHEVLRGDSPPDASGSNATTFTMAMGIWPRYFIIHVGDSRCYQFRNRKLQCLTTDQTMAQAMVDSGVITKEKAEASHWKHVLVSAMGSTQIEPELKVIDIDWGDTLLLCSDGLTRHVSDAEIERRLGGGGTSEAIAKDLLNQALERGGADNVTIVLVQVPAPV